MTDQTGVLWFLDACIAHGIPQERPDFQRVRNDVAELIAAVGSCRRSARLMSDENQHELVCIRPDTWREMIKALEACKGGA